MGVIGLVDITNPDTPIGMGTVSMGGEPTSVAVLGDYALVGVNTSVDFVDTSGKLVVVRISTKEIVTQIDLGGQPDSVAVSPNEKYVAVVIENERDGKCWWLYLALFLVNSHLNLCRSLCS